MAEQRALAGEQGAFVRAVVLDRPFAVLRSSTAAMLRQLEAWRLPEFNYVDRGAAYDVAAHLPASERAMVPRSRSAARAMPTTWPELLVPFWTLAGLITVAWSLGRRGLSPATQYGLVLAAGWLADVVLCGALSTPHDQYQTRAIWVLALAAIAPVLARRGSRSMDRRWTNPAIAT